MLNPETGGEPEGNPRTHVENITQAQDHTGKPRAVRQQCNPLQHHHDTIMIAYCYICTHKQKDAVLI